MQIFVLNVCLIWGLNVGLNEGLNLCLNSAWRSFELLLDSCWIVGLGSCYNLSLKFGLNGGLIPV